MPNETLWPRSIPFPRTSSFGYSNSQFCTEERRSGTRLSIYRGHVRTGKLLRSSLQASGRPSTSSHSPVHMPPSMLPIVGIVPSRSPFQTIQSPLIVPRGKGSMTLLEHFLLVYRSARISSLGLRNFGWISMLQMKSLRSGWLQLSRRSYECSNWFINLHPRQIPTRNLALFLHCLQEASRGYKM